jgi:NAD(P)-dependent dehydrogenase (short-subunit alcohol dehydrogenase family)
VRGSARFGAFAAGKFAVRALGQSLAREFGPRGVHVAHVVVDGVIDIPRTSGFDVNGGVEDGKISPDAVSFSFFSFWKSCEVGGLVRLLIMLVDCRELLAFAHAAPVELYARAGSEAVC